MAFMPHVNASVRAARDAGKARRGKFRVPFLAADCDVLIPLAVAAGLIVPWVIGALQIVGWLLRR
ncbi:hypothetical protein D3C71_376890 [compost metagenome]